MPTNDLDPESSTAGGDRLRFDAPSPHDGAAMWAIAEQVGLDLNSPYAYVMWGEYFAESSIVARRGDELVGFVVGFRPPRAPDTLFVWQIGVATSARRLGLGSRLLDELARRCCPRHVEATVTPDNAASASLFRSLGTRHGAAVSEELAFPAELFPGGHEDEIRFRIGPLPLHTDRPTITR